MEELEYSMENDIMYVLGFEDALMGFALQFNNTVAVYDYDKCLEILSKDMTLEEAVEYMEFNVMGAYVGPNTPVFYFGDLDE